MAHEVVVVSGPDRGMVVAIPEGAPLTVGRGDQSGVRLSDQHVSRAHCRLELQPGGFFLSDCGSSFGTFLNGQRVTQSFLRPGDVIRVGDSALTPRVPSTADLPTLAPTPALPAAAAVPVLPA